MWSFYGGDGPGMKRDRRGMPVVDAMDDGGDDEAAVGEEEEEEEEDVVATTLPHESPRAAKSARMASAATDTRCGASPRSPSAAAASSSSSSSSLVAHERPLSASPRFASHGHGDCLLLSASPQRALASVAHSTPASPTRLGGYSDTEDASGGATQGLWLGDPLRRTPDRVYYYGCSKGGHTYHVGDCVYVAAPGAHLPYVGRIRRLWETPARLGVMQLQWFHRAPESHAHLLWQTQCLGANPIAAIRGPCDVVPVTNKAEFRQWMRRAHADAFYYDPMTVFDPATRSCHQLQLTPAQLTRSASMDNDVDPVFAQRRLVAPSRATRGNSGVMSRSQSSSGGGSSGGRSSNSSTSNGCARDTHAVPGAGDPMSDGVGSHEAAAHGKGEAHDDDRGVCGNHDADADADVDADVCLDGAKACRRKEHGRGMPQHGHNGVGGGGVVHFGCASNSHELVDEEEEEEEEGRSGAKAEVRPTLRMRRFFTTPGACKREPLQPVTELEAQALEASYASKRARRVVDGENTIPSWASASSVE